MDRFAGMRGGLPQAMRWHLSALAALLLAHGAHAQSAAPAKPSADADADVEQLIQNERSLTALPKPKVVCPLSDTGEIVVCGKHHTDTDHYRLPSSTDDNPNSAEALRTGALHPPDVGSHPPDGVKIGFGHVPPPIYYIDTTKLPDPPPGSDADKIAKGEMVAP
jgi:hypothetical protein